MIRSKQAKDRIQTRVTKAAATRMKQKEHILASGKAYVAHNRKYEWAIIKGLYMAGMQPEDLLGIPECQGMSKAYLSHKIAIEKWAVERRNIASLRKVEVGATLQDTMKRATETHYLFMLKEIEDERRIIESRLKTTSINDQQARLDLLADFEGLARKTLGLDNMSANDPNKNSFNAMIVIQNMSVPVKRSEGQSGGLPLLSNKNDVQGNVAQRNRMSAMELEGEIAEESEQEPEGELSFHDKRDSRSEAEELLKSWRMRG